MVPHYSSPRFSPNIINKLTALRNVIRLRHLDHLMHKTHTKFYSENLEVDDMVMLNLVLKVGNVCVGRTSVGPVVDCFECGNEQATFERETKV